MLANARLSKRAVGRRSWAKFGDAVHENVGARLTMVSTKEIIFERPRARAYRLYWLNIGADNIGTDILTDI
ncbi:putative eukaryotic translation initiation factor 3 subunit G [Helianthus debilis subsp. tardiflorus]